MSRATIEYLGGRYVDGLSVDLGQQDAATFGVCSREVSSTEDAFVDARCLYGEPHKGLMAVRFEDHWFTSDGVNPNTGKVYTPEEVEQIRAAVDELHIHA